MAQLWTAAKLSSVAYRPHSFRDFYCLYLMLVQHNVLNFFKYDFTDSMLICTFENTCDINSCLVSYQVHCMNNLYLASFLAHLSWKLKWAFLIVFRPSSVCPSVCELFLFSTSSPEPLGQFQPKLAQSIPGIWEMNTQIFLLQKHWTKHLG